MNLTGWVVVFDLDDTLISEYDYQRSGISAVEASIASLYGVSFEGRIQAALNNGVKDIWGWACEQLSLPIELKTSFLWLYRLHNPSISLAPGVSALLDFLSDSQATIAILSDGRSVTQRLKLAAVGMSSFPLFVSEDYLSVKPNPERFAAIESQWTGCRYVYVADNPSKDFLAPNKRGWLTIGANWIASRVHQFESSSLSDIHQPGCWVTDPLDVTLRFKRRN